MNNATLSTPAVALGTWAWGDIGDPERGYFGSELNAARVHEIVQRAHSAGFTLWDTAAVYGMGRAESVLGEALSDYRRQDYQVSAKFTPQLAGDGANPVADMLAASLDRLRTDYADILWIHNPADVERWTPMLIPLLKDGVIKHVGVSNHNLPQIVRADEILQGGGFRVEAVQNHYSLLHRSSERAGILDFCQGNGMQFFSYMVLEQGALSGKYGVSNPLPDGTDRAAAYNAVLPYLQALTDRLAAIGAHRNAAAADVAAAWAIARGTTPIIGVTHPVYIDGVSRACTIELTQEDVSGLEALADTTGVDTRGWWEQEM